MIVRFPDSRPVLDVGRFFCYGANNPPDAKPAQPLPRKRLRPPTGQLITVRRDIASMLMLIDAFSSFFSIDIFPRARS
jgi:hypothetical protein